MPVVCKDLAGFIVTKVFFEETNRNNAGMMNNIHNAINIHPVRITPSFICSEYCNGNTFCNPIDRKKNAT